MKALRQEFLAQPSVAAGSPGIRARCADRAVPPAGKPALHRPPCGQRGIALVVTLILLSVVTFLAVAFLFLARRERGAVAITIDMSIARRAAESATEQAKVHVMASLISANNQFNYGLIVSTNYRYPSGFIPNSSGLTNVNYDYRNDGAVLNGGDFLQNVANLYYSPRPPVFVRTNKNFPGLDFRFYHDLNQNGRFETNGAQVELGSGGVVLTTLDTNGNTIPLTNSFVGDPEWVGVLERPDRPHSSSNKFVFRYCYIAVPSGKTLDINAIHNQSKLLAPNFNGFSRNMGVGPWELNLASFLVDLNTNVWEQNLGALPAGLPFNPTPYFYDTTLALPSTGTAFDDAAALTRYRYNGTWANLKSVRQLYGNPGVIGFQTDGADGYGSGPLLLSNTVSTVDGDAPNRVDFGWPGSENPKHFFTTQDLLDPSKTALGLPANNNFSARLKNVGDANDFYDRYTYYRLLSQLGTDSTTDLTITNKIHLNYVNVDNAGVVVPDAQTNFVAWTNGLQFFTNAADRLLRATFTDTNANRLVFGVAANISLTNIPVLVSNKFVYTPAVHRILQVTANIWDSTTNRLQRGAFDYPYLPSVFRPVFRTEKNKNNGAIDDIYIAGFTEVGAITGGTSDPQLSLPLDLNDLNDRAAAVARASAGTDQNIYGVPWVIGAKKGFPNFNEFAMQSVSQLTRKLQVRRATATSRPTSTNQLFVLGISNTMAFEAWNSYRSNYNRSAQVIVANDMIIGFNYTNDVPLDTRGGATAIRVNVSAVTNLAARSWAGYGSRISVPDKASFLVPLQTNLTFLPDSYFRLESTPTFTTNMNDRTALFKGFEQTGRFPIPQFTFVVSNRVRFIMIDEKTQRIVDYVQLGDLAGTRNLSSEVLESPQPVVDGNNQLLGNEGMFFQTNRVGGNTLANPPMGVINQINASLGNLAVRDWTSFGIGQASGASKDKEIDSFRVFMGLTPLKYPLTANTNIEMQAPFTPTRKTSQYITWQANDPLVHYTKGDLENLNLAQSIRENPNGPIQPLKNIKDLNNRFEPWGGRPTTSSGDTTVLPATVGKFSLEAKDPGVRFSDDWDFPTNKFATLGLLGRVHRGTPWQTVYLKANDISTAQWGKWSGNSNTLDSLRSRPAMDRVLVDVFTTAIDQNSTRGQLNINQTGIASWSALLGGVIGLTNSSTDDELRASPQVRRLQPFIIDPAGKDPLGLTNSIMGKILKGVEYTRTNLFRGNFRRLGDILAVPELTTASPLLNTNSPVQLQEGINDAVYERLPQQLLGLMRGGDQPSFTIYAYGQALHPANRSVVTSGPYFGLCTNYQITAEFATRTVVRLENAPRAPRVVVDSFNILPPE